MRLMHILMQLLKIDGPHAAPAQCYAAYHAVVLVGAGIGVTPFSSILKSVMRYARAHERVFSSSA